MISEQQVTQGNFNSEIIDIIFKQVLPEDYFENNLSRLINEQAVTVEHLEIIIKTIFKIMPLDKNIHSNLTFFFKELFELNKNREFVGDSAYLADIFRKELVEKQLRAYPQEFQEIINYKIPTQIFLKEILALHDLKNSLGIFFASLSPPCLEISDYIDIVTKYVEVFCDDFDMSSIDLSAKILIDTDSQDCTVIYNTIFFNMIMGTIGTNCQLLWDKKSYLLPLPQVKQILRQSLESKNSIKFSEKIFYTFSQKYRELNQTPPPSIELINDVIELLNAIILGGSERPAKEHPRVEVFFKKLWEWQSPWALFKNIIVDESEYAIQEDDELENIIKDVFSDIMELIETTMFNSFPKIFLFILQKASEELSPENFNYLEDKISHYISPTSLRVFSSHPVGSAWIAQHFVSEESPWHAIVTKLLKQSQQNIKKVAPYVAQELLKKNAIPQDIHSFFIDNKMPEPLFQEISWLLLESNDLIAASFFREYFENHPNVKAVLGRNPFLLENICEQYEQLIEANKQELLNPNRIEEASSYEESEKEKIESNKNLEVIFMRNLSTLADITLSKKTIAQLKNTRFAVYYIRGFMHRFLSYLTSQHYKAIKACQNVIGDNCVYYRTIPILYLDASDKDLMKKYQRCEKYFEKLKGRPLVQFSQLKAELTINKAASPI